MTPLHRCNYVAWTTDRTPDPVQYGAFCFIGSRTVYEYNESKKYALECLRLAADCKQLSRDVANPVLRSHYARMAQMWQDYAVREPKFDPATGLLN